MSEKSCENCAHRVGEQVRPDDEASYYGSKNGLCSRCTFGWREVGVLDSWIPKKEESNA